MLNAAHEQSRALPPDTEQLINLPAVRISALGKSVEPAAGLIPAVGHLHDIPGSARCLKPFEQHHAAVLVALGDDLHPAVDQVLCHAKQAELLRDAPDPPAEADALHAPADPGCQPSLLAQPVRHAPGQVTVSSRVPAPPSGHQPPCRGWVWHRGQRNDERFMNFSRSTRAPQLGQGSPALPYTARDRSKYPLWPLTCPHSLSTDVPPA